MCNRTAPTVVPTSVERRGEGGFTLLEVLIAFAIAAPALVVLYRQGAIAVGATQTAAAYEEAVARTQSRLASLADAALVPGDRSGDDGGGFTWRTRIVPVASAPPPRAIPRSSPYAGGTTLFAVTVDTAWPSMSGERRVTLNTRRIGPAAAVPP